MKEQAIETAIRAEQAEINADHYWPPGDDFRGMRVLFPRLPEHCAMCHGEIVDEGGTIDIDLEGEIRTYHQNCCDELYEIKKRFRQAVLNFVSSGGL